MKKPRSEQVELQREKILNVESISKGTKLFVNAVLLLMYTTYLKYLT